MPTIPTSVEVVNSADIPGMFQWWKDNGFDMTAQPVIVRETGELLTIIVLAGVTYVCGPEHIYPPMTITAQPYTANSTTTIAHQLPSSTDVLLTKWEIMTVTVTTLDGTHYWTVALNSLHAGVQASLANSGASPDTPTAQSATTFAENPVAAGQLYAWLQVAKTSTPGDLYVYSALYGRDILATLT